MLRLPLLALGFRDVRRRNDAFFPKASYLFRM
jgi:hypothetical protein